MLGMVAAFVPVAVLVTIVPGPATAMVVRSAARGGRHEALVCTAGNSIGVMAWPALAAVFYVALFPQFVPAGAPVLPAALLMAGTIVAFDLVWYSAPACAGARARRAFVDGPWGRRVERLTGAVLVALGVRLAFERR